MKRRGLRLAASETGDKLALGLEEAILPVIENVPAGLVADGIAAALTSILSASAPDLHLAADILDRCADRLRICAAQTRKMA